MLKGTGNPTITYTYDSFGNRYTQTDALGRTIIYYYGSKDNTNTYPDRRVNELGHADEYDVATGNIKSIIKHGVTFLSSPLSKTEKFISKKVILFNW